MSDIITGLTRGGVSWTPTFVTDVNAHTCIGCGRCYKVCPREVFSLLEKADVLGDDYEDEDDDNAMVMAVTNALDCIGCGACARVCPKNCHTHAPSAVSA